MKQPKLSVNINKIATIRNSRGGEVPSVVQVAIDCQKFGAEGITVHPRPDERHIKYADVYDLKKVVYTEFNIEGNPKEVSFIELVMAVKPTQVTLVPDEKWQLTSNHGWDTIGEQGFLKKIIRQFKDEGIRVSIFVNPVEEMILGAKDCETDRIELYTEAYASNYSKIRESAIAPYKLASFLSHKLGLGVNAGHDLSLQNLAYFAQELSYLDEVSIGHALISDALYFGLENTIQMYKRCLTKA